MFYDNIFYWFTNSHVLHLVLSLYVFIGFAVDVLRARLLYDWTGSGRYYNGLFESSFEIIVEVDIDG